MSIRRMAGLVALVLTAGCGGGNGPVPMPQAPGPISVTASAYILPGAVNLRDFAFGDEPVVIHPGERLRWVNIDNTTHDVVADMPGATDFVETRALAPGGEQSLLMTKTGTTGIHCSIHPQMVGTLIVRER